MRAPFCDMANAAPFIARARIAAWIVLLGCIAGIASRPAGEDPLWAMLILVSLLDVVVIILLSWWIRSRLAAPAAPAKVVPERSLAFVAVAAVSLGTADAFFFGQAVIAFFLCVTGALYYPLRAIQARKDGARLKLRLSKAAITSVAGFAALGVVAYGNVMARDRAESLIVSVERFQARHGRYPERLEEMVPEFVAEIPRAKYVVIADRFRYSRSGSRHSLMYVEMPPFGRRIYTFEDRQWTTLD